MPLFDHNLIKIVIVQKLTGDFISHLAILDSFAIYDSRLCRQPVRVNNADSNFTFQIYKELNVKLCNVLSKEPLKVFFSKD